MDSRGEEFGPYRVYEQIGVGGMATVHRAETSGIAGFRKTVALKRMLPHVATDVELVKSFVREARLASHLRHSNVAQTFDLGKVGDIYFIAMELVTGHNLREILRHCLRVQIRIPIPVTLNILNQVCDALDYAHNLRDEHGAPLGIIHRDVSPSNVIVSESGVVKLIDFGIAKASSVSMQTMSGTIKGKFGYMAPEYLAGTIDARADLFALGIIAYELLTNRPLFTGRDDMDTLFRVKSMPIPHPSAANPEIPEEIDAIVMTALARDPDKRWQRAQAMRMALTHETKRLGMTLLDQRVVEWCEWAFQQGGFDRDSEPSMIVIREPEMPTRSPAELDREIDPDDYEEDPDDAHTRVRSSSQPPRRQSEILAVAPAPRATLPRVKPPSAAPPMPAPRTKPPSAAPPMPAPRTKPPSAAPPISTPMIARPPSANPLPLPPPMVTPSPAARPPTVQPVARITEPAVQARAQMGNLAIAVLLVLAAAAAGAVVYFGLPYIQ